MARKKICDRKRQTKINFSPASQSTQAIASAATASTAGLPTRPPQKQKKLAESMPSTTRNQKHQDSTSEDELVVVTKRGMFSGSRNDASDSESINGEEEQVEKQPEPKSRKRRREEPSSESEDERPTVTVIPRKRQRRTVKVEIGSSDEGNKNKEKKRAKKEKKKTKERKEKESTPEPALRSTRRGAARKSPIPDDGDEEEDELRRPSRSSKRKTIQRRSPSVEEQEEDQSPPRSARRKLKRRRPASEDEDEAPIKPEPREHETGALSASDAELDDAKNNEEKEELREELAYLRSSPVADRGLSSTHKTTKNKRQEALEALKRRRAGTTEPSSSATPGRRRAVVVDTDSDSELDVVKEEPDSDVGASGQGDSDEEQESDREANALDMFQEDQDDDQFIDDDEENVIGEPSANADLDEMRLAFSLSRAKTKELFRHAVEWMVMKKIHPGFESTKYIYTATFRKLDDEVKGLAGSKYTSSAWTADFTRAICARPDIMINDLSAAERAVMSPHCEACNRTNHTASSEILLQGQPYHPETLEPIASDSDSDSNSDSSGFSSDSEAMLNGEKPSYNYRKERIPPESHRFPVGSTCRANAQVAHTLYHWRYHLYQWVKDYLKAEGHLTAEKLVKRDGWSDRKRDKAARKIVNAMEAKGQIRELYHSYKNQVTAAVEADNDYRNGWGRNRR